MIDSGQTTIPINRHIEHPNRYQSPNQNIIHNGRSISLTKPTYNGDTSNSTEEKTARTVDTSPDAKGKVSVKPVSRQKAFYEMLFKHCLPLDDANQDTPQRVVKKSRSLINQALSQFFQSLKKTEKTEGLSENRTVVDPMGDLLKQFAKSPYGERLYRKSAAENLVAIESLLRTASVNIDHQSKKSGNSPLIAAVLGCHWDMASTLINSGAKANTLNKKGQHVLRLLFQAEPGKMIDDNQRNELIVQVLKQQSDNRTIELPGGAMHLSVYAVKQAALSRNIPLLNRILHEIPLVTNELGQNMQAQEILRSLVTSSENLSSVVEYLLNVKTSSGTKVFNPGFRTMEGDTPLMLAAKRRKYLTMKVLLNDPVVLGNINQTRCDMQRKWSAYTYVDQYNNTEMLKLLREKGAAIYPAPPPPCPSQTSADSYSFSGTFFGGNSGHTSRYNSYGGFGSDCGSGFGGDCGGGFGGDCGGF